MKRKFELPYKALLDGGVKFYASLGNHDDRGTGPLRAVQHGWPDVLHVQGADGGRAVLCPRDRLPERAAGGVAREGARELERATGRSRTSTIRSTRPASGTGRTRTWPRCSNRSSSRPASASCSLATIISTSGSKPQTGHRPLRHRVRRPAAQGRHRPPHRPDGGRLRHRSARFSSPKSTATSSTSTPSRASARSSTPASSSGGSRNRLLGVRRFPFRGDGRLAGGPIRFEYGCNLLRRRGFLTMTPTSRRPSSSSLRRLWLPTKNAAPSRMIARTCSRRSASFRVSTAGQSLLDLADDANLDAGLAAAPRAYAASSDPTPGRCRSAAAVSRR